MIDIFLQIYFRQDNKSLSLESLLDSIQFRLDQLQGKETDILRLKSREA